MSSSYTIPPGSLSRMAEKPDILAQLIRNDALAKARKTADTMFDPEQTEPVAETVVRLFLERLSAHPDLENALWGTASRHDYSFLSYIFSSGLNSHDDFPGDTHRGLLQVFADSFHAVQRHIFSQSLTSVESDEKLKQALIFKRLFEDKNAPLIALDLSGEDHDKPMSYDPSTNTLTLHKLRSAGFSPLELIQSHILQEGVRAVLALKQQGTFLAPSFVAEDRQKAKAERRDRAGIIDVSPAEHAGPLVPVHKDGESGHQGRPHGTGRAAAYPPCLEINAFDVFYGRAASYLMPHLTLAPTASGTSALDADFADLLSALCDQYAFWQHGALSRAAVSLMVERLSDDALRSLTPKQRKEIACAVLRNEDRPPDRFFLSEMQQAARLMQTVPLPDAFAAAFNCASQAFLATGPLSLLQNWAYKPWPEQRQAVRTILEGMEACWQNAAQAAGDNVIVTPGNAPHIGHAFCIATSGFNLFSGPISDPRSLRTGNFNPDSRDVPQEGYKDDRNTVIVDYDRNGRSKGEIICLPRLSAAGSRNKFWMYAHAEDVLTELSSLYFASLLQRFYRVGKHAGADNPFYDTAIRFGAQWPRFEDRVRGDDISVLFQRATLPLLRTDRPCFRSTPRDDKKLACAAGMRKHPFHTMHTAFIDPSAAL